MTNCTESEYAAYCKKVWMIYSALTVALAIILVAFVASDNEERLFFSLMTVAAAYVFRPTERTIQKYVLRIFGVSSPEETTDDKS